ncbi:hypothetical protein L596_018039 [Steinernema carpocapsae]|uniref:EGF-like domain-containing protein n=1 Tax=Steinernema carpocapsae TaxID=34508 RepID=A0A4V6A1W8_STECR|nr:hypothetical protein L596_018039 [Steinernema carpocapsae]
MWRQVRTLFSGLVILFVFLASASHAQHPFREHQRYKRQFDASHAPQIDLNITVPYIFSARLYPFGQAREDFVIAGDTQAVRLKTPLKFIGKSYNIIFIKRDGAIVFKQDPVKPAPLPRDEPVIAAYWMPTKGGKVYYRETEDPTILNLAQSEVNIQYRYGNAFKPSSVLIVTWENTTDANEHYNQNGNIFQMALIMGPSGCFAHVVYSKLSTNNDAIAGFSGTGGAGAFSLPGSGAAEALQLSEKSDIGIPGEWLFRLDDSQVFLCGAGFKGLECIDPCDANQWYLDCSRSCHCESGNSCNSEDGACPDGKCSPGWRGASICDQDIDECAENLSNCPEEQPDCLNTPGAFMCICFEYDNKTNSCKGANKPKIIQENLIPVPVLPIQPNLLPISTQKMAPPTTTRSKPSSLSSALPTAPTTTPAPTVAFTTLAPLTIRPSLGTRAPTCRNCDRNAQCVNGDCVCVAGWTGDGKSCRDVDECLEQAACGPHAQCENAPGSYHCICNSGFTAVEGGCVDLNECDEGVVCNGGNTSMCINTEGGFECRCREGYTGHPDGPQGCIDVNECDLTESYCGANAMCHNRPGSFLCECFEGYEKDESGQCVDMNECMHEPCDKAAVCMNLEGSFQCTCIDGFIGNGVECRETILYPMDREATSLPSQINALMPFKFVSPLKLFGNLYDTGYISGNGVISFDRPFHEPINSARQTRSVAFFPMHTVYNLTQGEVSFRQVSEGDAGDYGLLTRSSLSVQNRFHLLGFKTKSLYIVTFNEVHEAGSDKRNTFQVVFAQGENATFVTFLYEELESAQNGVAGVSFPGGFMDLPTELLLDNSNIGQKGKWLFRVDQTEDIGRCPAGLLSPPLCQQDCPIGTWGFDCESKCHCADAFPCDFSTGFCSNTKCAKGYTGSNCYDDIDECALELHNCSKYASCLNSRGSYDCKCNDNYYGNGFNCSVVDNCFVRFGEYCSGNARCDETNPDAPECICNDGFHGDGLICLQIQVEGGAIPKTTIRVPPPRPSTKSNDLESREEDKPFMMKEWITEKPDSLTTKAPPRRIEQPVGKDYHDVDNEIIADGHEEESTADMASLNILLAVFIFGSIWLVVMIVLIAVYCYKRTRSSSRKLDTRLPAAWRSADAYRSMNSNFYMAPQGAQMPAASHY